MKVATLLLLVLPCITWAKVFFYNGQNHQHFQDRRNDRDNCLQFFKDGMPPTGFIDDNHILQENVNRENANQFAVEICQKYKGTYHFATLYNTKFRTPIYSAYIFPLGTNPQRGQRITEEWKYEGGLLNSQQSTCPADRINIYAFVKPECSLNRVQQFNRECTRQEEEMLKMSEIKTITYCLPASDEIDIQERLQCVPPRELRNNDRFIERYLQSANDYGNKIQLENEDPFNFYALYDKGHLFPQRFAGHYHNHNLNQNQNAQENIYDREATFTMTNAAPQNPCLNRGAWSNAEAQLLTLMRDHCKDSRGQSAGYSAYFITGTGYNKLERGKYRKKIPPRNEHHRYSFYFERVAVPDFFWTAACCVNRNDGFGVAYISDGNEDGSKVKPSSIADLEKKLSDNWEVTNPRRKITLFPNTNDNPCYKSNAATKQWAKRMEVWAGVDQQGRNRHQDVIMDVMPGMPDYAGDVPSPVCKRQRFA